MKASAQLDPRLRPLVPQYLANRQHDCRDVREALGREDFAQISGVGHRLAGSGTSYGFPQISLLGQRLEEAGQARDLAAAGEAASELEALVELARASL